MSVTLQTPQIVHINAFDPSSPHDITFLYDDNQSVKNRLIITDNSSSTVVYDAIQIGMRLSHTIPADTLTAGNQYIAQVQVFDADGNSSNLSDQMLFYCFLSPTFNLSGVTNEEVINKATLSVSLNYSQTENETIKSYQFFLYDSDNTIRTQSSVLYNSDSRDYTFYDLGNEKSYYIRCIGETTHGMSLDTGLILFHIQYIQIPANIVFEVANHKKDGTISLFSGIIDIGYDLENNNYTLADGLLTLNGNKITYNKGFSIDSDFILHIEAKQLPLGTQFLQLNNGDVSLSIKEICGLYYCCLCGLSVSQFAELPKARIVTNSNQYITTSDGKVIKLINADYEDGDLVVFELKRIDGIYGLSAYYKSDVFPATEEDIA